VQIALRRSAMAGAAAATARLSLRAVAASTAGRSGVWRAVNYRGEQVSLLAGPVAVLAGAAGGFAARSVPARVRRAAVIAAGGAVCAGRYDDRYGDRSAKGFAGHLGALAGGRVGTGAVKVFGIGASGLVAGALVAPNSTDGVLVGAVVAGTANLVNLLDLRPGRALKAVLLAGLPLLSRPGSGGDLLAGPLGAAAALLPADLAERTMLGDAGANGLGALLGVGLAVGAGRRRLGMLLLLLTGLTAASEVVSFSAVIDRVRPLRRLDRLGRRPLTG